MGGLSLHSPGGRWAVDPAGLGLASHVFPTPPGVAAQNPPPLRPCPAQHPQHETDEQTLSGPASLAVLEASMAEFYGEVMEGDQDLPEFPALVSRGVGCPPQVCPRSIHSSLLNLHPRTILRSRPMWRTHDVICLRNWLTGCRAFKYEFGEQAPGWKHSGVEVAAGAQISSRGGLLPRDLSGPRLPPAPQARPTHHRQQLTQSPLARS